MSPKVEQNEKTTPSTSLLWKILSVGLPQGTFPNIGWQTYSSVSVIAIAFLYSLIVARCLGVADFGLIALGMSIVALIFRLVEATVYEALVNSLTDFLQRKDHDRAVASIKLSLMAECLSSAAGLIICLLLSPLLQAYLLRDPRGMFVLVTCALAAAVSRIGSFTVIATLRVFEDYRTSAMIRVSQQLINLIGVIIVLVHFKLGISAVLIVEVLSRLAGATLGLFALIKQMRKSFSAQALTAPMSAIRQDHKRLWCFVRNTYFSSLTLIPARELDINVLGLFLPIEVVGAYQIAKRFMQGLDALSDIIISVIFPAISKLWHAGDVIALRFFIRKLTQGLSVLGIILYLTFAFGFPVLISHVLGHEFARANSIFQVMLWPILFRLPLEWAPALLLSANRSNLYLRGSILSGVITVVLLLILVPLAGELGAALSYGLSLPLLFAILYSYVRKEKLLLEQTAR